MPLWVQASEKAEAGRAGLQARFAPILGDAAAPQLSGANPWTLLVADGAPGSPERRQSHAAAWDSQSNRMLVFGSLDSSGIRRNDLWQYTTSGGWQQLTANGALGAPQARNGAKMVWDAESNRLLLFGGQRGDTNFNDLWQYTANRGWQVITALNDASAPSVRYDHSAVWDSQGNRLLIFGGQGGGYLNDLWQWSAAGAWQRIHGLDEANAPPRRDRHSAVWDAQSNRMLVFGGCCERNDLWQYTTAQGWVLLSADGAAGGPERRSGHSAVWDTSANRMLVFGGQNATGTVLGDTWQYSSRGWEQRTNTGATGAPPARRRHSAVWDASASRMLVFGGGDENGNLLNDLWQYVDNAAPIPAPTGIPSPVATPQPTGTPSAGSTPGVTTTPGPATSTPGIGGTPGASGTPVVGGTPGTGPGTGTSPAPIPTGGPGLQAGRLVYPLCGPTPTATPTSDGTTGGRAFFQAGPNGWTALAPQGPGGLPLQRTSAAAASDPLNTCMFLFGGRDSNSAFHNDLWRYTPAEGWRQFTADGATGSPSLRADAKAAWDNVYDTSFGRVLIFGGQRPDGGKHNDLWQFSHLYTLGGTVINAKTGFAIPGARISIRRAFDGARTRLIADGSGRFSIDLAPFAYQVTLGAEGFESVTTVVDLAADSFPDYPLPPIATTSSSLGAPGASGLPAPGAPSAAPVAPSAATPRSVPFRGAAIPDSGAGTYLVSYLLQATREPERGAQAVSGPALTGTVVNANTGAPIAGAIVTLIKQPETDSSSTVVVTDAAGNYAVTVAPGSYVIVVSAAGFIAQSQPINLTANTTLNFRLIPIPLPFGTVSPTPTPGPAPVEKFGWTLIIDNDAPNSPPSRSIHSATWDTVINRLLTFGGLDSVNAQRNDLWQFGRLFPVTGSLSRADKSLPIPAASVIFTNQFDGNTTRVLTGASGSFNANLAAGTYTVTLSAPGFGVPAPQAITVPDQSSVGFSNVLPLPNRPPILSGGIRSPAPGAEPPFVPLSGANITAVRQPSGEATTIQSDTDGTYSLILEPGRYVIVVSAPAYQTQSAEIDLTRDTLRNFTMSSTSGLSLHGVINNLIGQTVQGTTVLAVGRNTGTSVFVTADNLGRYWIDDIPADTYDVRFSSPGYITQYEAIQVDGLDTSTTPPRPSPIERLDMPMFFGWTGLTQNGFTASPPDRQSHSIAYDNLNGRLLMFGGNGGNRSLNDLWQYTSKVGWQIVPESGPEGPPNPRFGHTLVWDNVANRMLMWGGADGQTFYNEPWEYTRACGWRQLLPQNAFGSPASRQGHVATWDGLLGRMLVAGGDAGSVIYNDFWQYVELSTILGGAPAGRSHHTAVWDTKAKRMIVFGGFGAGSAGLQAGDSNDAVDFSGACGWHPVQIRGSETSPANRYGHVSVWDPQGERMLIFGGQSGDGARLNDLWQYTTKGGSRLLSQQGAAGAPAPRTYHAATWDEQSNRLLVFGGFADGVGRSNDLWEWTDARGWRLINENGSGGAPTKRDSHTAVWDTRNNRLLVFGGFIREQDVTDELWEWTETGGWKQLSNGGIPLIFLGRAGHAAVWDNSSNRMLVYGGVGHFGDRSQRPLNDIFFLRDDLWQYTAERGWELLTDLGEPGTPEPRTHHSAVWDRENRRMLVYAGWNGSYLADLWEYTDRGGWKEIRPTPPVPPAAGVPPVGSVPTPGAGGSPTPGASASPTGSPSAGATGTATPRAGTPTPTATQRPGP
ncbi:MAG: carboxypeptidase regulatory-like domain-containing protein [Chloroflexi bacterium]|nr:carboxypeptidase regulatory-like domain-containing protein [Chloroflexota bacterium]